MHVVLVESFLIFARPKSVVHSFAVYKFMAGDLNRGLPVMCSNLSDGPRVADVTGEGCAWEEDKGQRVSVDPTAMACLNI